MARKRPTKKGSGGQAPAIGDDKQPAREEVDSSSVEEDPVQESNDESREASENQPGTESTTESVSDLDKRLDQAFTQLENNAEEDGSAKTQAENRQTSNRGSVAKVTEKKSNSDSTTKTGTGLIVSFGMLISILALVVAGYAAYLLYESRSELSNSRAALQSLETQMASLQRTSDQKLQQMAGELKVTSDQIAQSRENENAAISELRTALESRTEQLRTELKAELDEGLGTSGEDWLLAEVEYLIRLANQRVLMERDASGAIALLTTADEIVEQTSGIAAYELRESLAHDIANLKAVSDFDTDGIFLSLSAMSSQVPELPRKRPELSRPSEIQVEAVGEQNYYQQFLAVVNNIATRVLNSVDYRRDGVAITPMLPPKEEYYLRQNLILKFEMAQLALLRSDGAVYRTSLSEAKTWVVKHFVEADPRTVALIASLDEANKAEVDRTLPNISGSLRAVRGLLNTFHQQDSRGAVK